MTPKPESSITSSTIEWGNPTHFKVHGIAHLRSVAPADNEVALAYGIEPPIRRTWFAKIDAGGFIVPHIDAGPWLDRWHVPIEPAGFFWDEEQGYLRNPLSPFRVKHWIPHAVGNPTQRARVHLIVDRDVSPPNLPDYTNLVLTDHRLTEIERLITMSDEPWFS